jgi:hypothetical protein
MKRRSRIGSDGTSKRTPFGPKIGHERLEHAIGCQIVEVIHVLLPIGEVGVELGVPVH